MNKKQIYLADLCHTAQGMVSELTPYGIGCIKSFFNRYSKHADQYEIRLFKYPKKFIECYLNEKPAIVGFSNYIWNLDLSHNIAKEIKKINPSTLIIFGGPNFPLEDRLREGWLKKHDAIDLYIIGEAERPFKETIECWHEKADLAALKIFGIEGCFSILNDKMVKLNDATPRLGDSDTFPSPYLEGYLDEFLNDEKIIPLLQTNRGCAFTCTYCEKGSKTWQKVSKQPVETFKLGLEYIAKRCKGKVLVLADNNFGMFPRDIEISKIIAKSKEKYDYPLYVSASTSKNAGKRISECVNILKGSLPITASVQSLDPEVLTNIKRKNLPYQTMRDLAKLSGNIGTSTRSEVILALPGDSKEKHFNTIYQLIDAEMQFILPYTLILLDGSELATYESRSRWKMKTKFRLNHRCFGEYPFNGNKVKSAEIEEVVVGLDTMSFDDYIECRLFDLSTFIFISDDMLYELLNYLSRFDMKPSDLLSAIHNDGYSFFSKALSGLYEDYKKATINELWNNKEELERYVKSLNPMKTDDKIIGYNILFRHRAIVLLDFIEEIITVAFQVAKNMLKKKTGSFDNQYLDELMQYMICRKRNPFKVKEINRAKFSYDFLKAAEDEFRAEPKKLAATVELEFSHSTAQEKLFAGFDSGLKGVMRMIPRLALSKIYRNVSEKGND